MKKLDDKIIKEEEELKVKKEGVQSLFSCNCCEGGHAPSSSLSKTTELTEKDRDHREHREVQKEDDNDDNLNEKFLISIGLALTIPIVLLELIVVYPHSYFLSTLISLALATPIQILLGRPFYIRFIRAITEK